MLKVLPFIIFFLVCQNLLGQSKIPAELKAADLSPKLIPYDTLDLNSYKVVRIKSIRGFYIIYAVREDRNYKIVSEKAVSDNKVKIKEGNYYALRLLPVGSQGLEEIGCYHFGPKIK